MPDLLQLTLLRPAIVHLDALFLASVVSQTTFALTLGLLAGNDRRSRGLLWLSAAAALHLLTSAVQAAKGGTEPWLNLLGLSALVLLCFCGYKGMQHLIAPPAHLRRRDLLQVSVALAALLAVYVRSPPVGLLLAHGAAIAWTVATLRLLFFHRVVHLRRSSLLAGIMLSGMLLYLVLRVTMGFHLPPAHGAVGVGLLISSWLTMLSCLGLYKAGAQQRLYVETRLDALTGLDNRRSMDEMAEREIEWAARHRTPLALLMIDADHFKQLNDTWGHALGDRALQAIAQALAETVHNNARVARVGGEEFAVLLPYTDADSAAMVAEHLRRTVEHLRVAAGDEVAPLTVSIGVSLRAEEDTSWTEMLRRADIALYRAKREGRNRVVLAGDQEAMPPLRPSPGTRDRTRWMRGYSLATLAETRMRQPPVLPAAPSAQGQSQDTVGIS